MASVVFQGLFQRKVDSPLLLSRNETPHVEARHTEDAGWKDHLTAKLADGFVQVFNDSPSYPFEVEELVLNTTEGDFYDCTG